MLLLAALNPKPLVSVRLLTSRSPALPLGVWLAAGGGAGALLSGLATALALLEGRRPRDRAQVPGRDAREPWSSAAWSSSGAAAPEPEQPRRREAALDDWIQAGPQRGPGEPAPTVTVPVKVLRRPQRSSEIPRRAAPQTAPAAATTTAAGTTAEGHGPDDWDSPVDEDW